MNTHVNYDLLAKVPAFQGFSGPEIAALTAIATKSRAEPSHLILREGDFADCFYLLCSGNLEVLVDHDGTHAPLAQLGPGQVFGEMPLVYKQPIRQASVVALTEASLLRFDYADYEQLAADHPNLGEKFWKNLGRIADSRLDCGCDHDEDRLLRECRIFAGLLEAELGRVAEIALPMEAAPGEPVVRVDDPADRFFLVTSGQVEVQAWKGERSTPLARLGKGQVFGEMTLIYHQPMRFASVVALEPTTLLAFPFETFESLMEDLPVLRENLRQLAASRSSVLEES